MVWNYRIGKRVVKGVIDLSDTYYENEVFGIYEVYYDEDGDIQFTTENPVDPYGETQEELIECLEMMLSDAKKHEVLDLDVLWEELKNNSKGYDEGETNE